MRSLIVVLVLAATCAGAAPHAAAQGVEPATGAMLQVRMPVTSVSSLLNNALGVPQFAVGLRRERYSFGLGLGLSRADYTDERSAELFFDKYEVDATLFQMAPTLWYEFWRAEDGTTVGNLIASVQYGRINYKQKSVYRSDPYSYESERKGSGNLLGFGLAFGGDHYLGPHFALGVEAGAQGSFATDIKTKGETGHTTGFSSNILYGAIRSTIVF